MTTPDFISDDEMANFISDEDMARAEWNQPVKADNIFQSNAQETFTDLSNASRLDPSLNPITNPQVGIDLTNRKSAQQTAQFALENIAAPAAVSAVTGPMGVAASRLGSPLARMGVYAAEGATDAAINYGAQKLSQELGAPQTTGMQDANQALDTVALDTILPSSLDAITQPVRGLSSMVNSPKALSRQWGATATQANETVARKTPAAAVEELMSNPEFRDNVVGNTSVNRAYDYLREMKRSTGADIGMRYQQAGNLTIDTTNIVGDPRIQEYLSKLGNPYVTEGNKKAIQGTFNQFMPILGSSPNHSISNLWMLRQQVDDMIDFAKQNKDLGLDANAAYALRDTLSDHITSAIERSGVKDLKDLNQRYNNLAILEEPLGKRSGQINDNNMLGFDTLGVRKMGAAIQSGLAGGAVGALFGGPAGVAAGIAAPLVLGNPGRATLFNVADKADMFGPAASSIIAATPDILGTGAPRPPQLPRDWQSIKTDSQHLNAVEMIAKNLGLMMPEESLTSVPDEIAKKAVGAVAEAMPQFFMQTPDKVNAISGEYQNQMHKDVIVRQALSELPPEQRALVIGGSFRNKYVPTSSAPPLKAPQPLELPNLISRVASAGSAFQDTPTDYSYDNSTTSQLEQLTDAEKRHVH